MKMVKLGLAALLALTALTTVHAQTADDIVNKHIDAIGGKDKLATMKSLYVESSVQVMGNDAPSTLTILDGKGYRQETNFNGQKIINVVTDKGGWAINPMGGGTDATALPDDAYKQAKDQIDLSGPLYNYAAKGNKVELLPKEGTYYILKVTNADKVESTYTIDGTTYYITKIVNSGNMMGQPVVVTRTFSNFKKADNGIVFPYTTEIGYGEQFSLTSNITKMQFNNPVDPKIFDMPK